METQAKAISYGYGSDDTKGPHSADADTHGLLIVFSSPCDTQLRRSEPQCTDC